MLARWPLMVSASLMLLVVLMAMRVSADTTMSAAQIEMTSTQTAGSTSPKAGAGTSTAGTSTAGTSTAGKTEDMDEKPMADRPAKTDADVSPSTTGAQQPSTTATTETSTTPGGSAMIHPTVILMIICGLAAISTVSA